jgi:hypothetical protein
MRKDVLKGQTDIRHSYKANHVDRDVHDHYEYQPPKDQTNSAIVNEMNSLLEPLGL